MIVAIFTWLCEAQKVLACHANSTAASIHPLGYCLGGDGTESTQARRQLRASSRDTT